MYALEGLRIKRTSYGISQQELSERLGIDRDDLNAYEVGVERVRANLLLRIAELLLRPDYFFRYTEEELDVSYCPLSEHVEEGGT
jgi:transcriptional regulator with XRE-family HTH domain